LNSAALIADVQVIVDSEPLSYLYFSKSEVKKEKVILEMIAGHCRLRKNLHTIRIAFEPDCRKCGREEETAHHIVCECPAIISIR